jgi:hypothetical protein
MRGGLPIWWSKQAAREQTGGSALLGVVLGPADHELAGPLLGIETAARQEREEKGLKPLGPKAILAQDPFDRPEQPKKSPAPLFHAVKREVRKALWEAYAWFVAAFREAAEKLRAGDLAPNFPIGSFPPPLPFVSEAPA